MVKVMRRYGGGCVDIFVGPYLIAVNYGGVGAFGWREDWPRWRIWLARRKRGVVFGRWDDEPW